MASRARRVPIDVSKLQLELDSDELRELLAIPPDLWDDMADSQKLLLLAKRGIQLTREAIERDRQQDG